MSRQKRGERSNGISVIFRAKTATNGSGTSGNVSFLSFPTDPVPRSMTKYPRQEAVGLQQFSFCEDRSTRIPRGW